MNINKHDILKKYFGYKEFRTGQAEVVESLLSGRDALCVMPTGAGKSICYQVPALIFSGVTIVVSPLISLMKDQVSALSEAGISAAFINSSLSYPQTLRVIRNAELGVYKIIYVAPERLETSEFMSLCQRIKISMVAVDEVHCVSQWGQDFRPSYLKIIDFVASLPERPVVGAFTATATQQVKEDVIKILKLDNPFVLTTGFDRPNLLFSVIAPKRREDKLFALLREKSEESGIVYCATRKTVEQVCLDLQNKGFNATRYHAGLSEEERRKNQDDFVFDRSTIMVATNAFGMGIDKSNVSYVIHYNMPKNIESYYQEAGRAGRDGEQAECILLYSPADVRLNNFLIDNTEQNPQLTKEEQDIIAERDRMRLKYMTYYCTTSDCLRAFILKYFGEKAPDYCGKCSNCVSGFETVDITVDTQKIISCIVKTGQRFGKKMICDVLRGMRGERLLNMGLQNQSTYGIMKDCSEKRLRSILDFLEEKGFIFTSGGEYPVLKAAQSCRPVLKGEQKLSMKLAKQKEEKAEQISDESVNTELLSALKKLRRELAQKSGVPAYVVFSDATLTDMSRKQPKNEEEFLEVYGVGNAKLEKYGDVFIQLIRNF